MKFLVLLAFVAVSSASLLPLKGVQKYPKQLGLYKQGYGEWYPTSYGQESLQWLSQIPSTNYYYKYIQECQGLYQHGAWPIISQIYEQMSPSQYTALETLISRIGFEPVEVLLNYLAGNSFHFSPEKYQTLVTVVEEVGYPTIEEVLKVFAGEKFHLVYQQNDITFTPTFTLPYILQELQQYSTTTIQHYDSQYPENYRSIDYKRQTPYSSLSVQKMIQPYYNQYTPVQGQYYREQYYKERYPEHLGLYKEGYGELYPTSYGRDSLQWVSLIPSTNYYYKYIQECQGLYQHGAWPIISQIYEQMTPSQYTALETLISRIGFEPVEVILNYLAGNTFYFTPEKYQTIVTEIEKVGHPSIEEVLKVFAGEKFHLVYQQNDITFTPTFSLPYILQELQQYSTTTIQHYESQYPQSYRSIDYKREIPYSSWSVQKRLQPYYSAVKVPHYPKLGYSMERKGRVIV